MERGLGNDLQITESKFIDPDGKCRFIVIKGKQMKYKIYLILLLIFLFPLNLSGAENMVSVGVLANRGYDECIKKWQPTIDYLSRKIPAYKFQLVPLSFEEITPAVRIGKIDFLLCNPSMYVDLQAIYNISRIATIRNKVLDGYYSVFGGVIFTRRNNQEINTIHDLQGKRFLAADPESFGGLLAAWRELYAADIEPEKDFADLKFTGNQDAVVYDVMAGKADAGTCRTDLLETLEKAGKIKLNDIKVIVPEGIKSETNDLPFLVSTRLYPEWPFAKLASTPEELATKVTIALLSMDKKDPAAVAAGCGGWTYPLNYQPVHELKMELKVGYYKYLGQISLHDILKKYWMEIIIGFFAIFLITASLMMVLFFYKRLSRTKKALDAELLERRKIEEALREEKDKLQAEISERLHTEDLLSCSEEKYRSLIDNVNVGVFRSTGGAKGRFIEGNPALYKMFGCSSLEELLSLDIANFYENPAERIKFVNEVKQAGSLKNKELLMKRKDGSPIWVSVSAMANYDEQGEIVSLDGVTEEITERKRMEQALQESEEKYRLVFSNVPLGIFHIDDEAKITACNEGFVSIVGGQKEMLIGVDMLKLKDQSIVAAVKKALGGHTGLYEGTFKSITSDRLTPIKVNFSPVISEAGEVTGAVGIMEDVTEQKQIERIFMHDVLNTAVAVRGFSELLEIDSKLTETELEYMGYIKSLSGKIVEEIQTHRHLITSGRVDIKLDIKHIHTTDLINDIYNTYNRPDILSGRQLQIADNILETELQSDRTLLSRVLGNMVKNAIEASGSNQTVTMGCRMEDDMIAFWVHNSTYIPQNIQDQLFTRSFSTKGTGRGLGLYSMKSLTEEHLQGQIYFISTEAEGTTFVVKYPSSLKKDKI